MDLVGLALKKMSVLNITVLRTFLTTQQSLQRRRKIMSDADFWHRSIYVYSNFKISEAELQRYPFFAIYKLL